MAKKSAKKATRKRAAKKSAAGTAVRKKGGKKSKSARSRIVLLETDHNKAKLAKLLPGEKLQEVELWVRKPESTRKEHIVTMARLCGQSRPLCIGVAEHD